jgi:hypothetical protein
MAAPFYSLYPEIFALRFPCYFILMVAYIQLDTLLHVVLDDAIQLGYHQQITPVLEQFLKFHDHSGGTPDSIVQAYPPAFQQDIQQQEIVIFMEKQIFSPLL